MPAYPPQPTIEQQAAPAAPMKTTQPTATRGMTAGAAPTEESEQAKVLRLRGGRSEMCPGRFCFIIPCPIPCDFCII